MKHIAAIRTNKWTEEEERLLASLRPYFGEDVVVVFHNRTDGVNPPVDVVDITDAWIKESGLKWLDDWGWRCGDYSYYRLREARPEYDHYWLIEPDVVFSADTNGFFGNFENTDVAALGLRPEVYPNPNHRFAVSLSDMEVYRAIFALTRFSDAALDYLFEKRKQYSASKVGTRFFANDELFCFTHLHENPEFEIDDLEKAASEWFDHEIFTTDPDVLFEVAAKWSTGRSLAMHPVRSKNNFKNALANRLGNNVGFLKKQKHSLAMLEVRDIEDIAEMAKLNILVSLKAARSKA